MELPKNSAEPALVSQPSSHEEGNTGRSPDAPHSTLIIQKSPIKVPLSPDSPSSSKAKLRTDELAEIQDLTRIDKNERTVLHRAALDQNVALVRQLCDRAEKVQIQGYVDTVDKFGNTPLLTACVVNHNGNHNKRDKLKCIGALIKRGAYLNKRNDTTLWTPLMWCSFYGDTAAIKLLLENKANPFVFDKDGLFPLDHCGLQDKNGNRKEAATVLIEHLMQMVRDYDADVNSLYQQGYEGYERYMRSPLLRTSMLYWAIYFKLSVEDHILKLLATEGVYPDFPIRTISERNCYHACAYAGNTEVLQILLDRERHQRFYKKFLKKKRALGYGNSKATIEREEADRIFDFTLTELKTKTFSEEFVQYAKDSAKWILKFESIVARIVNQEGEAPRHFEAQDSFGNTSLHVASFLGKSEIVDILLKQGTDIEIENKDGWRCQELRQYEKIEQLYKEHIQEAHKKQIAETMAKDVGVSMHILPLANAIFEDKKSDKMFNIKNIFRKSKIGISESIQEQSKKLQRAVDEKISFINERRFIPDVVMVFQTKQRLDGNKESDAETNRINFNISLIKGKFDCYLAVNHSNTLFYLMIKMNQEDLERECANNGIKIKLLNSYNHQVYDASRKVDFEPFRSRQRQEITLVSLSKLIDIQQLKDIGILKDIYTMHTISGITRIKEIWMNKKWYWPEPLASMKDYFREGKYLNFTAITTLRIYFGEKVAYYFAWASFYTNFLVLLAVPGLVIFIALEIDGALQSFLLPIWVIYNSLCSTLVVERWKRKSAEIATRWGTVDMTNETSSKRIIRTEFIGDETVHETTGALTKINTTSRTLLYFLISLPILLVLLAAVVASFLGTQYIQNNYQLNTIVRFLVSAVNGFLLSIINILYSKIARFFVDKENHKYSDTYENSLIFKVFIFQFLNSNLGLFYVIFYDKDYLQNVQYLMISLLVSKQISSVSTTCIIPWLKYKFRKSNYFKSIEQKARLETKKEKERVGKATIQDKTKKELVVSRSVLNCRTGNPETDNWDITRVELSGLRTNNEEFVDEYGQMFSQCGYVTMFAPANPIGPAICLVANVIDIRAKLFALLHIHHRPPVEKAGDIGYWQTIWEVISIIGVFVNAVILFFNSEATIGFLETAIMDPVPSRNAKHDIRRLWVFLILVHLMLVIKLLVIALIKDKPAWVLKEEKKQIHEERQALQNQKTMTTILDINKDSGTSRDHLTPRIDADSASTRKKNTNIEGRIDTFGDEIVSRNNVDLTKGKNKNGVKQVHYDTSKATKNSLPLNSVALELNHGIKSLLYNSYTQIEKDLIMKRLGHIANLLQEVIIKCDICKRSKALLECLSCSERYCEKCLLEVHNKTMKSSHKIIYLDKSYTTTANLAMRGSVFDVVPQIRDFPTRDEEYSETLAGQSEYDWQKLESFSFPIVKVGDPYNSLEKAYKLLHRVYIEENGISPENTIINVERALKMKKPGDNLNNNNVTKGVSEAKKKPEQPEQQGGELSSGLEAKKDLLLGKQYDLGEIDYSWLDEVKKYFELSKFNLEEKLWMNRIAFMVFKKRGAKATYNDFYRQLKILEESQLEAKSILLFDLLDEDSDGVISVADLLKLLNMSFLQNIKTRNHHDEVMKVAFSGITTLDKKGFMEKLLNNDKAKLVIRAYLQVREK